MSKQVAPCGHGHRRRYADGFAAFDSLVVLRHRCPEAKKFDVFECECGGWHIGFKPAQSAGGLPVVGIDEVAAA